MTVGHCEKLTASALLGVSQAPWSCTHTRFEQLGAQAALLNSWEIYHSCRWSDERESIRQALVLVDG